jgi:hypothetical protein
MRYIMDFVVSGPNKLSSSRAVRRRTGARRSWVLNLSQSGERPDR